MISIIVNKFVDSLENSPEQWDLCTYVGVKYASRPVDGLGSTAIEVFEDKIEFGCDTLNIPKGIRGKVEEALDNLSAKKARDEGISAEQAIYKVVSGW